MEDLRHLRHFLAMIEAGGIREASRRIHLSASSVARSVQMLEEHYGVPLVDRDGPRMEPTAFGVRLADEARGILASVEGIGSHLGQVADLSTGVLRIGISPSVVDVLMPLVGTRLLNDYPRVQVESRSSHMSEAMSWLIRREIDLAIGFDRPFALRGGFEIVRLYDEEMSWWVRSDHPLAAHPRISAGDLVDHPLVSQYLPDVIQMWLNDLCLTAATERGGQAVVRAHQSTDYSIMRRLALSSDAILFAPSLNVLAHEDSSRFTRLQLDERFDPVNASVMYAPSPPLAPLAQKFLDLLREESKALLTRLASKA